MKKLLKKEKGSNMDIVDLNKAKKEFDDVYKEFRKSGRNSDFIANAIIKIEKKYNIFEKRDYEFLCYYLDNLSLSDKCSLVTIRDKIKGTFKELDENDLIVRKRKI